MTAEEIRAKVVPEGLVAREGFLCEMLQEIAAQIAELTEVCKLAEEGEPVTSRPG